MQYDWIILGATFTAAGMASVLGDRALILESRPQAGYEFISAMKHGTMPTEPGTPGAKALYDDFVEKGVFDGEIPCLFSAAVPFYERLRGKNILLNLTPVEAERVEGGFRVTAHGVSGFREFTARRMVDTRVHPWQIAEKRLNLLITPPAGEIPAVKYGPDGDLLISCPLSLTDDWPAARQKAAELLKKLPAEARLLITADEFDYSLQPIPLLENGIDHLPSAGFANPVEAFEAGERFAKEVVL